MHPRLSAEARGDLEPFPLALRDRRRSTRIPLRLAVEVYDLRHFLGRYWIADLSQEGLFLRAERTDRLANTILRLCFAADGIVCSLRGAAVREVLGQGVGIQLAFWRRGDDHAHAAYRRIINRHGHSAVCTPLPLELPRLS